MQNENTQELFDKLADDGTWPSRYTAFNYINYNFITRRNSVKRLINNDKFGKALDIGCGTGDYVELLSDCVEEYTGVDFSQAMIDKAQQIYKDQKIRTEFIKSSGESLPFEDDKFDFITAIGFIEYFANPDFVLEEIKRVLKNGGVLIIQSYQIDFFRRIHIALKIPVLRQMAKYIYYTIRRKKIMKPVIDIPYSKKELDLLLSNHGFKNVSYEYNNFNIFPKYLRQIFSKIYIKISESISNNNPRQYGLFAANYIGRYELEK